MPIANILNKTMDIDDLKTEAAQVIIEELNALIREFQSKNLPISSWYGHELSGSSNSPERWNRGYGYQALEGAADDKNFPWFLYWELVWVVLNNDFHPKQKVLDLGGCSSLFSYYLASKGLEVTAIDIQEGLVNKGNETAKKINYNIKNYCMDMRNITLNEKFDHIVSICVYEHIPMYDRIEINKRIKELLVDGGKLSLTFDYRNLCLMAAIHSPQDIYNQFVQPSGLKVRGNKDFVDNGKNYLLRPFLHKNASWLYKIYALMSGYCKPLDVFKTGEANDYTFAALFLEKS